MKDKHYRIRVEVNLILNTDVMAVDENEAAELAESLVLFQLPKELKNEAVNYASKALEVEEV